MTSLHVSAGVRISLETVRKSKATVVVPPFVQKMATAAQGSVYTWGRAKNYRLGRPFSGRDVRVPEEVQSLRGRRIRSAACGGGHTAVILEDDTLHVFGYSQYGQLGLGDRTDICDPSQILLIPDGAKRNGVSAAQPVAEVCCGRYHTIARSQDGQLWSWGGGKNGRLGHGDERIRHHPAQISALKGHVCTKVISGYHCNLSLMDDGKLFSWGWGAHGQLGLGDANDRDVPTLILSLSGIKIRTLACGDRHAFAVTESGQVYAWGSNQFGQLGFGRKGDAVLSPTLIPSLDGLIGDGISSGDRHSAAITNTGALYTWGCGSDGQCGHGNFDDVLRPKLVEALTPYRSIAVCCGHNFTLALTSVKRIFAFGNNTYGQLGNNGSGKQNSPVEVTVHSFPKVRNVACGHFHCILWTEPEDDSTSESQQSNELRYSGQRANGTLLENGQRNNSEDEDLTNSVGQDQYPSAQAVGKENLSDALSVLTAAVDDLESKRRIDRKDSNLFENALRNLKALSAP